MLETDGDDGRAVVDAISQTYDKTVENRDSIKALTADTEDGAEADGPITANTKKLDSLDGRVTQNEEDIDTLMEDTDMNAAMISTNAGNIVTNRRQHRDQCQQHRGQ